MLSSKTKQEIANKIQAILQEVEDSELPTGEIQFILHIDGAERWSWANIRNNGARNIPVCDVLMQNLSA